MRRSDFAWIVFGIVVALGYGAAKSFAWDPGSASVDRERIPTSAAHGAVFFTYWSTGFGGK